MPKEQVSSSKSIVPRLRRKYQEEIVPALQKECGYTSPMQVPLLLAIHVNQGIAEAKTNPKLLDKAIEELAAITGQQPVITKAKNSIANFKLREGMKLGLKVTLRGRRMYEFLDRLISFALPRSRDFEGLKRSSFDKQGNYTFGVKENIIFPEINIDKIDKIRGMDITLVTSAKDPEGGYAVLKALGVPFERDESEQKQ